MKADNLPSNDINEVTRDVEGNLWIATVEGAARYSPEKDEWTRYGKESGLTTNFTTTVTADGNRIWLGTARGLATFDVVADEWQYYTKANGLSYDFTTDHKVWIGTNKGFTEGKSEAFGTIDELAGKAITAIAHDGDSIWIGTENGLYGIPGLANDYVNTILTWGEGNIWAGTRGGSTADAFQNIEGDGPVSSSNILAIEYDDKNQKIWVGMPSGLSSFSSMGRDKQ